MSTAEKALAQRIRELRRRHFGPRGKAEFAQKLGLPLEEYERFERGKLPPGELMVRMCELTGEDLQWLLTGRAARGAVVISGARRRHQHLLTQIARALDARPGLAAPLEAFLGLLLRGEDARQQAAPSLPTPAPTELIPLFGRNEWPDELPDPDGPGGGRQLAPILPQEPLTNAERVSASLAEPAMEYDRAALHDVTVLALPDATGPARRFVQSGEVARCFPMVFGVVLDDETMEPMFLAGDSLLVAVGVEARIGRPALCKFADRADDRCRVWLGEDEKHVHLGRVSDGQHEQMPRAQLRWSLEVLYRVAQAA
ncbi:MAG: helix-turn-helix domain-containing protein [Phycisphaerae bacterium]